MLLFRTDGTVRHVTPASYAMTWQVGDGPRTVGRIEVEDDAVALAASRDGVERIGFRELARVLLERGVLHLERTTGVAVHIGSLDNPGALRELAERLAAAAG